MRKSDHTDGGKPWLKWVVSLTVAVAFFVLCALSRDWAGAESGAALCGLLSDCFAVPGVVLGGVGGISWIATFGQFDMLAFGTRKFFGHFIRPLEKGLPGNFYEYREAKNQKGRTWLKETFFVGLAFLVVGGIMLALYYLL